ncbi:MAG: UvrD-helicase domain-containing protein, partial [Solirubrobacterales bacterium]
LEAAAAAALAELEGEPGAKAEGQRQQIAAAAPMIEAFRAGAIPEIDDVAGLKVAVKQPPAAVAAYDRAVGQVVERLAADLYEALRVLVTLFGRGYEELKSARSALDFEDLHLRAVRLLREAPALREEWQSRFEQILVDEFQDTNRLQVELIDLLRSPSTRLFTVGDEFQAIYGFRHADVSVFRAERERGEALSLRGNFRSDPAVLGLCNALGEAILPNYRPLLAGRESAPQAGGAATELLLAERGGWDEEDVGLPGRESVDAPADRVAEAALLARRLAELAEPVESGGSGIARGEMVLLLRAFTHVTAYEEALERAGLRPLVVGGRGYWSQQQVEDMRCLLGVIANPLDDESLFGALASPACGVSPDALWLLRAAAGRNRHVWPELERLFGDRPAPPEPDSNGEIGEEERAELERRCEAAAAIAEEDAELIRLFCARVADLRRRAGRFPLDELVDETASAFDYDLAVLQRDRGRRRWANVRKLMRLARAYEEASGRDLTGFNAMLAARTERDDREPEAQTEVEGHDGVRVMTIHNAKGLEFALVAVADFGRDLGAGGFQPAFRARPSDDGESVRFGVRLARAGNRSLKLFELDELAAEANAEESAEDRRLAYVAVTRARRRLLLSGVLDPGALSRCAGQDPMPARASVQIRLLAALGIGVGDDGLVETEGPPAIAGAELSISEGGSTASVLLPAPEALDGTRSAPPAEFAVRLERAHKGAGRELVPAAGERGARDPTMPSGTSPLASPSAPAAVASAGHLSNAALDLYASCGYRFYVERVLGLRPEQGDGGGGGALAFGSAVHALLEWSARNRWLEPPRERCEAELARAGHEPGGDAAERAAGLVRGWLGSPLREQLAAAPRTKLMPEAPFLLDVGGQVVRGTLDLLAASPDGVPTVVDYKTNALRGRAPVDLMPAYETQRDLYALASARALGVAEVRTAFVFLEAPEEPVVRDHDEQAVAATRERLEALAAGVAAGRFEVTANPHRELCQDCPARPRLCVYETVQTMAEPEAGGAVGAPGSG